MMGFWEARSMQAKPCTRVETVTLGEVAEAFMDAAGEVFEDAFQAKVAGAAALWGFLERAGKRCTVYGPHRTRCRRSPAGGLEAS